jgi:hypothetical protein
MSSFDQRDIRRTMDVYTADNVYLGTVLRIESQPDTPSAHTETIDRQPQVFHNPEHAFNGEQLGPASTAQMGNQGPTTQSALNKYGASSDAAVAIGRGSLHVGKWWGLAGKHILPLDAVQAVSLERVVLRIRADDL